MNKKISEWLNRYLIPTGLSLLLSLWLAMAFRSIFHNSIITALAGTWGDNLGFYGLIIYKDIKERKSKDLRITAIGALKVLRNAITEFGPGEYFDSFIIRPLFMWWFPQIINNDFLGIFIAKFAADITFFVPTIVMYEIRKRVFKD